MNLFSARDPRQGGPGYSVVDDHLTIRGEIDTDGTVRVDGRVEGVKHRAGTLIVGAEGRIIGDVEARDVLIAGAIRGNVYASGRVEIESGAAVDGDIRAGTMVLREGAALHGQVAVGTARVATGDAVPALSAGAAKRLELAAAPSARARG